MNKYWPPLLAVAFALGIACAVPTAAKDLMTKTVGAYRINWNFYLRSPSTRPTKLRPST